MAGPAAPHAPLPPQVAPLGAPPVSPPWRKPVGVGAAAVAGTAVLGLVDPSAHHVPLCPLAFVTGLDCPACGSLRAVHGLAHLDLADAIGHNALFVVLAPFLVLSWAVWLGRSLGLPVLGDRRWPRATGWLLLAAGAAFALARNHPRFAYLDAA